MRHRESREYVMTIVRAAKVVKLGDVHNQLDIIWNGLDVEFQSDIDPPIVQITLNQFLTVMDVRKNQWWTKAIRTKYPTNNVPRSSNQPQNRGNSSQYNNQRGMPNRPMNSGSQNSGRPSQPFPYQQNYQAYNQYQNRQQGPAYQSGPAYPRRDQQALPAPPVQRQITAGPSSQPNAYGSRQPFQPNNSNGSYQSGGALPYRSGAPYQPGATAPNRPPYQAASNRGPYPQRAYQASVESEEFAEECQENSEYDPDSFHGDYNHDVPEGSEDYSSYHDYGSPEPEVNFVDSLPPAKHSCYLCQKTYRSRNKLFQHLKQECWKKFPEEVPKKFPEKVPKEIPDSLPTASLEVNAATEAHPRIIESATQASPRQGLGTAFRGYQHTKADARFSPAPEAKNHEICLDPGCPITLGDRDLLAAEVPDFEKRIQKQASPIPVRGYGNKITNATEFIVIDLYFPDTLESDGSLALAKIPMEVHLTENLKANMLLGTDVFTPQKFLLECASQSVTIFNYQNLKISAKSIIKPYSQIKRVIKTESIITLPPKSVMNIPINYASTLFDDRDFLFEPELPVSFNLGFDDDVFVHIVDSIMSFVQARNFIEASMILPKNIRLNTVMEYAANGCYQVSYKSTRLTTYEWRISDVFKAFVMNIIIITMNSKLKHVFSNGVIIYENDNVINTLTVIVTEFENVFTNSENIINLSKK